MKRFAILFALILAALPLAPSAQTPDAQTGPVPGPKSVVGTFDRSSIVLAFYRSPLWAAILADRRF